MKSLDLLAVILVVVGAVNWGLVGIARLDLVHALLGGSILAAIVYTLVGIAGVYLATQAPAYVRRPRTAS
jgi:uncharacterized membrane protein YuzA (DUF378 family)